MDSVTQITLGAAVGEAVLGKKIGNKAPLYGAIAGTIPDLDVLFTGLMDYSEALLFHRGVSHSFVFAFLAAILCAAIVTRFEKYKQPKGWFWLFFLAFVTHALLDAQTTWGVQLLWPLQTRFALDNIFIVDPFYTLPFAVFLVLAMLRNKKDPLRRKLNQFGVSVSCSYLMLSLVFKAAAFQKFESALIAKGISYSNINTRPSPMNIVLWSANVETEDTFLMGHYSLLGRDLIEFDVYQKERGLPRKWESSESLNRMIRFTEGWYLITKKRDQYYFNDLRSGAYSFNKGSYDFVFTYEMFEDETGDLSFLRVNTTPNNLGESMHEIWQQIIGR